MGAIRMKTKEEIDNAYDIIRWGAENAPKGADLETIKFLEGAGAAIQWIMNTGCILAGIIKAIDAEKHKRSE
jgi:hypothetical protein